jgi:hypothetical protein
VRSLSFDLMGIADAMARWYVAPTVSLKDGGGVDAPRGQLSPSSSWASFWFGLRQLLVWPRNSPRRWWLLVDSVSRFATHPDMVSWTGLRTGLDVRRKGLDGRGTRPRPPGLCDFACCATLGLDTDRMLSEEEFVALELMSYPGAESLYASPNRCPSGSLRCDELGGESSASAFGGFR